ncbi:MAG: Fur family transcriptional regulator [Anaeroplasmataceae bacterium]
MKHRRNTSQQKYIIEELAGRFDHPTAQQIFESLKQKHEFIGIATIYRNLNKLVEEEQIKKIVTHDSITHYDKLQNDHIHLICKKCNIIYDVPFESLINKEVPKLLNFKVSYQDFHINGFCENCNNNE